MWRKAQMIREGPTTARLLSEFRKRSASLRIETGVTEEREETRAARRKFQGLPV